MASRILYLDLFEYSTDQLAQAVWVTDATGLELDYMEYATAGAAQAAYVTSDAGSEAIKDSYTEADTLDIGLSSVNAWQSGQSITLTNVGELSVTKVKWYMRKGGSPTGNIYAKLYAATGTVGTNAVPTGSALATSDAIDVSGIPGSNTWIQFTFSAPYTVPPGGGDYCIGVYYSGGDGANQAIIRCDHITKTHHGQYWTSELGGDGNYTYNVGLDYLFYLYGIEANLQCDSEDTIKQQGSYSLNVIAVQTDSLNDTLTKSGLSIDLSGRAELKIDFYAERTGTNIQVQIHDSGGQTSTKDIAISSANEWETTTWDISGIDDADKDDIDSIIIKIIEASSGNTFYVDNFRVEESLQCYSEDTIKVQGDYSLKVLAAQTGSLNKTLTKTLTDYLDYSVQDVIKFDVRASRTGTNIQLQIHDVGGTTSTHNINIASVNEWQTETWDISGITGTDRDTIDEIIIKVSEATVSNTIYMDNLYSQVIVESAHVFIGG